jgi:hypothetical protein
MKATWHPDTGFNYYLTEKLPVWRRKRYQALSEAVNDGDGNRPFPFKDDRYPAISWKTLPRPNDLLAPLKDRLIADGTSI